MRSDRSSRANSLAKELMFLRVAGCAKRHLYVDEPKQVLTMKTKQQSQSFLEGAEVFVWVMSVSNQVWMLYSIFTVAHIDRSIFRTVLVKSFILEICGVKSLLAISWEISFLQCQCVRKMKQEQKHCRNHWTTMTCSKE